jgi:hypothetical protein
MKDRERLLGFLARWRRRLLATKDAAQLSDEQFGALVCLNTLIHFVEFELIDRPLPADLVFVVLRGAREVPDSVFVTREKMEARVKELIAAGHQAGFMTVQFETQEQK